LILQFVALVAHRVSNISCLSNPTNCFKPAKITSKTHAALFLGEHVDAPKNINYDFLKPADHYHIFSLRISLLPDHRTVGFQAPCHTLG
jgi:hypothetical protein